MPCVAGLTPTVEPASYNTSLIQIASDNVTFESIELINVTALYVDTLLLLTGANNTLLNVVSQGCHAHAFIVTIQNAASQVGQSSTVIAGAYFTNFSADAISMVNSSVVVSNSTFSGSTATALTVQGGSINITRSSFSDSAGPAVSIQDSDTVITGSQFASLAWNGNGAGVRVRNTMGNLLNLTNCIFSNNNAAAGYARHVFCASCCLILVLVAMPKGLTFYKRALLILM